jgi:hypothetical protein
MAVEAADAGLTREQAQKALAAQLNGIGMVGEIALGTNQLSKIKPYVVRTENKCPRTHQDKCAMVKLWTVEFGEITDIRKMTGTCEAIAEFTVTVKRTPAAEFATDYVVPKDNEGRACFSKYDDGWRLDDVRLPRDVAWPCEDARTCSKPK